jgi:hypothetical protein
MRLGPFFMEASVNIEREISDLNDEIEVTKLALWQFFEGLAAGFDLKTSAAAAKDVIVRLDGRADGRQRLIEVQKSLRQR